MGEPADCQVSLGQDGLHCSRVFIPLHDEPSEFFRLRSSSAAFAHLHALSTASRAKAHHPTLNPPSTSTLFTPQADDASSTAITPSTTALKKSSAFQASRPQPLIASSIAQLFEPDLGVFGFLLNCPPSVEVERDL